MKKNIVIIILSILLIGLSGYLVYDKVLKKNALEDVQQNEDNQGEELKTIYNKDSAWLNYLKSVNITSAKISFVDESIMQIGDLKGITNVGLEKDREKYLSKISAL